jgi:hypothetical protein
MDGCRQRKRVPDGWRLRFWIAAAQRGSEPASGGGFGFAAGPRRLRQQVQVTQGQALLAALNVSGEAYA